MSYNPYTPPYNPIRPVGQVGQNLAQARNWYSGNYATNTFGSVPAAQQARQQMLNYTPQGTTRSGLNYYGYRGGIYHKRKTHKRKTHKRKTHKRKTRRSK